LRVRIFRFCPFFFKVGKGLLGWTWYKESSSWVWALAGGATAPGRNDVLIYDGGYFKIQRTLVNVFIFHLNWSHGIDLGPWSVLLIKISCSILFDVN